MSGPRAAPVAPEAPRGALLDAVSPRVLFGELVEGAARATRPPPTPLAIAYLADLLGERIRVDFGPIGARRSEPSLAEEWLEARQRSGPDRLRRLHALGDRALFVSGFFGESLHRSPVGPGYYRDIGRTAYADLARRLADQAWTGLFEELADRFRDYVDLLAEVGDRARPGSEADLLRLYERYLETGSAGDARRLRRRGLVPPPSERRGTPQ